MKVKELIEKLQKINPETTVFIMDDLVGEAFPLTQVYQATIQSSEPGRPEETWSVEGVLLEAE